MLVPPMPVPGHSLVPQGLSEEDCASIVGVVQAVAATWHTDLHEDAFGLPSLTMAPCRNNRLKRALIAFRIDATYILAEVRESFYHEIGEFQTLAALLEELRVRLVC